MTQTDSNSLSSLIGKQYNVEEINTLRRFDNSQDYVIIKKTKAGEKVVLKPEVLEEIKTRLEQDG